MDKYIGKHGAETQIRAINIVVHEDQDRRIGNSYIRRRVKQLGSHQDKVNQFEKHCHISNSGYHKVTSLQEGSFAYVSSVLVQIGLTQNQMETGSSM